MTNKFLFLSTALLSGTALIGVLLTQPFSLQAQEATTSSIRQRLQQAAQQGNNASNPQFGLIGQITRVSTDSVTLQASQSIQILAITPSLKLINNQNNPVQLEDLVVDNWAAVIANEDGGAYQPQLIKVLETAPLENGLQVVLGTIAELTNTNITIDPRDQATNAQTFEYDSPKVIDLNQTELTTTQLEENQQILAVVEQGDDPELVGVQILSAIENDSN